MRKFRDIEKVKEDLRNAVDLVDFIRKHNVELSPRGDRWIGLCPFHNDRNNPGFAVSPNTVWDSGSKGVWACWTCNARGDLFGFAMQLNSLTFFEALNYIAEVSDFNLAPYYRELTPEEELRENQYAVMGIVADLFVEQLLLAPGPQKFFAKKGIGLDILREFKIGFCPSLAFFNDSLDAEVRNLIEPQIPNRRNLFAGRILYPQFTAEGRVWGWYARQPDTRAEGIPKYIGPSKAAPLFEPIARLYGLHSARKLQGRSKGPIILVEGFHDVLAGQQAGFPTVGMAGTKLAKAQEETLAAHSIKNVVVALDPDEAGRSEALTLAMRVHKIPAINFKFADLELEPEEFLQQYGPEQFQESIDSALTPVDYIVSVQQHDTALTTPTQKRDFLARIAPFLLNYSHRSIERALGIQAVANLTGLSETSIADYLDERNENLLVNLQGELIVLAELALNPAAWTTLNVTESDFSLNRYREVYRRMRELWEEEIGEISIDLLQTHAQNQRSSPEAIETISRLPAIRRKTPEIFARDIRDKTIRRRAIESAEALSSRVADTRTPVLETVAGFLNELSGSLNGADRPTVFSSVDAVALTATELDRRSNSDTTIAGLDLGPDWEWLTETLNGLRPKRIIGIGAVSGVGKSLTLMNWIYQLSVTETFEETRERPAVRAPRAAGLIASMEMECEENVMRLVAIGSKIPHSYIDHARFESNAQGEAFYAVLDRIQSARLTWMTGHKSIRDIALQARILQDKGLLDYIAIDYVQLLDLTQYSDRWSVTEKYNQASQDMHDLSVTLNVPIIFCAQLNRQAFQEDIPSGEHIGSALKIYQDSHSFFIIARKEGGFIGNLDKNRGSGLGHVSLAFDSDPQTSTLRIYEKEVLKRR